MTSLPQNPVGPPFTQSHIQIFTLLTKSAKLRLCMGKFDGLLTSREEGEGLNVFDTKPL